MPDVPSAAPAGWFPDGSGQLRYWDGSAWTQHVAPMVQPAVAPAPGPSAERQAEPGSVGEAGRAPVERATASSRTAVAGLAEEQQEWAAQIAQREAAA
jgi:hypothetical protein